MTLDWSEDSIQVALQSRERKLSSFIEQCPSVCMCMCLHTRVVFLSSFFSPSSFSIWFCFAFYLQCVVLLWVLLMHVELRFPKESVWHWKIKINFFVFHTLKALYYKLGFLLQGSRMSGRAEIPHCWESISIKTALYSTACWLPRPQRQMCLQFRSQVKQACWISFLTCHSYGLTSPPQCFPLDVWIVSCWEPGKTCLETAAHSLPLP